MESDLGVKKLFIEDHISPILRALDCATVAAQIALFLCWEHLLQGGYGVCQLLSSSLNGSMKGVNTLKHVH